MSLTKGLLTAAMLHLLAAPLGAQFNLGTITGTVVDPGGGAVAGCTVKVVGLTNVNTRTVTTITSGIYAIPSLSADTTFDLSAFKRFPFGRKGMCSSGRTAAAPARLVQMSQVAF